MIGLLGDSHCGFAMSDGLVEPAEGAERGAKQELRRCRCDRSRSETLSAQLSVESDAPLERFGSFAVLAPDEVCVAKMVRCDHLNGAIAEGARDGKRLVPEFESCIVVASGPPLHYHEGGDPPEPVHITERPSQHLRLVEVISHAHPFTEREKRIPNLDADFDGQLASPAGPGQMTQRFKCLLEIRNGLAIGATCHGAEPRL